MGCEYMNCKNCLNFQPERRSSSSSSIESNNSISMEASSELSPNSRNIESGFGRCSIADKSCRDADACDCGGFVKRK